jgi:hypothetical protein
LSATLAWIFHRSDGFVLFSITHYFDHGFLFAGDAEVRLSRRWRRVHCPVSAGGRVSRSGKFGGVGARIGESEVDLTGSVPGQCLVGSDAVELEPQGVGGLGEPRSVGGLLSVEPFAFQAAERAFLHAVLPRRCDLRADVGEVGAVNDETSSRWAVMSLLSAILAGVAYVPARKKASGP